MTTTKPKVSLITTVYNREQTLERCLDSILEQTFSDWELILFDDGSTDKSTEICEAYALKDSRVKTYQTIHIGRVNALDQAHNLASGDFHAWVDSDDFILPRCVEKALEYMDESTDVVYTDHLRFTDSPRSYTYTGRATHKQSFDTFKTFKIGFHFRLMRATAFKACGGIDTNFEASIDYELVSRLYLNKATFKFCPEVLYYHNRGKHIRMGNTQRQEQREAGFIIRKRFDESLENN